MDRGLGPRAIGLHPESSRSFRPETVWLEEGIMSNLAQKPSVAIASLSIRDFRGIDRLDLDFRGPDGQPNSLVVLAGPNGCGKTAVLEAALILAGGTKLITGLRGRQAIRRGANDYDIKASFQIGSRTTFSRDAPSVSNPPLCDQVVPHLYFSSWRAPTLVGPVGPTVGRPGRRPARTDQNRLRIVKQLLVNAATVERFANPLPQFGHYTTIIREINDAWREFYPDTGQTFAVEIVSRDERQIEGFDVYLRTPDGPRLEVDLLSSGQLEVFLFLSTLALNEGREGIIFIDEPELHLDPQWHRLILRSLMRLQPRAQLVIATHSPEVYDAAASYERHYLVPEADPRFWLWPQHDSVESGV
jgi:energy-coupling factor transporter ATP-binding protein EcfA2